MFLTSKYNEEISKQKDITCSYYTKYGRFAVVAKKS